MITPAQNFLKKQKITYKTYEYKCTVDHDFGKFAATALNIKEDCFAVSGIFKSKEFLFDEIVDIKYGEINFLKETIDIVRRTLVDQVSLIDLRNNRKLNYCLVIFLKNQTILFGEEYDTLIKKAYENLLNATNKTRKKRY